MQSISKVTVNTVAAALAILVATGGCESGGGGGCGGSGCGGLEKLPAPFPKEKLVNRPAQVRLADNAFKFFEQNAGVIINIFLPGGLSFDIPKTDLAFNADLFGKWMVTCDKPNKNDCDLWLQLCPNGCKITGTLDSLNFNLVEPDSANPKLKADIKTTVIIDKKHAVWWLTLLVFDHCELAVDAKDKDLSLKLTFIIEKVNNYLTFNISDISLKISENDFDLEKCGVTGWLINLLKPLLMGILNDQIKKMVDEQIPKLVEPIQCLKCDFYSLGCPTGYTCSDKDPSKGYCVDSKSACAPNPLGVAGVLDIGALLASLVPGLDAKVDLAVIAGQADPVTTDKIVEAGGISLSTWAGVDALHNECVPATTSPVPPEGGIKEVGFLNSATICPSCVPEKPGTCPADTTCDPDYRVCKKADGTCPTLPIMAGIGVHEFLLNKVFWTAYDSGALCLSLGTAQISMLDSSILATLGISEIKDFLADEFNTSMGVQPVMLTLRPQQAPVVKFGPGVVKYDAKGAPALIKPLLTVELKQVAIDFYLNIYERYTRIFTMTADLVIPASLNAIPSEKNPGVMALQVAMGDIGAALQNVTVTNTEILATPAAVLQEMLGVMLPKILSQFIDISKLIKPIEIPAIQGFLLDIMAIRGEMPYEPHRPDGCSDTDNNPKVPGCLQQFLTVYADLSIAPPGIKAVSTKADVAGISYLDIEGAPAGIKQPVVKIDVGGSERYMEFSYRVDGGFWTLFRPAASLTISEPILRKQGKHVVEIRSREAGMPITTDMTGVRLEVVTDYTPPKVKARYDESGGIKVEAADWVTSRDRIRLAYRVNDGDWVALENGASVPADVIASSNVELRAVDEAGLERLETLSNALENNKVITGDEAGSAQGAAADGKGATAGCSCAAISLD